MQLSVTASGHIYIKKGDDLRALAEMLSQIPEAGEFCVTDCLESAFIAELCAAGFLVMSYTLGNGDVILIPKYHSLRSTLFFDRLHISRSVRRFLPRYELKLSENNEDNKDFDRILDACVTVHGGGWLTGTLLQILREIRMTAHSPVQPVSFGLYREGALLAGEFGVIAGRVYTSYSGYRLENSAGRVQMILTAQYLAAHGFSFWDLGMPLPYKNTLGAVDIPAVEWTRHFRAAAAPSAENRHRFTADDRIGERR
jgi:leucyl/phenylalanyl-tRNA--protein transferase